MALRSRPIARFVLARLAWLVGTLLLISVLVFLATQALPGDPVKAILGNSATPERTEILRKQLGLDRPVSEQYFSWLKGVLHGDLGTSVISGRPVTDVISGRVANSFWLMLLVCIVAIPLSVGLALTVARRQGRALDRAVNVSTMAFAALPEFVVGIGMVYLFATGVFHVLPAVSVIYGSESVLSDPKVLVLPALTLIVLVVPYLLRLVRASALEVLESEYIRSAHLRGVRGRRLLTRHALPNVAPPMLQAIVLVVVYLVGGVVIVEAVFNFPGMGLALIEAVRLRDLPLIQALVLIIAALYLLLTAAADIATMLLTPKARTVRR
jgi:peptide/nickel transport system permease protein